MKKKKIQEVIRIRMEPLEFQKVDGKKNLTENTTDKKTQNIGQKFLIKLKEEEDSLLIKGGFTKKQLEDILVYGLVFYPIGGFTPMDYLYVFNNLID